MTDLKRRWGNVKELVYGFASLLWAVWFTAQMVRSLSGDTGLPWWAYWLGAAIWLASGIHHLIKDAKQDWPKRTDAS